MIALLVAIRVVRRVPPTILLPGSVTLTTEMRVDDEALARLVHLLRNKGAASLAMQHAHRVVPG